ncbi:hypothetical protein H2198_008924 [Neophaeococcomyces mojaviensis]|uniref:Uncharacterized protein n=1 Tax=Neophaeococcomyces mojaviensis TaxID=3383035 RepID=A0ACC2ZW23_9EURO|nr:hypothetical protein H2198_008924 [Knufia sp. JES_112]
MSSSNNPISALSKETSAPGERIHAFQDPTTRILYVLPRDTELGQQYAQLTSKDEQAAFMAKNGRNTGTLPEQSSKGEGMTEEAKAHIADMKEKGYVASRDEQGNWVVSKEEAYLNRIAAHEAFMRKAEAEAAEK